MAVVTKYGTGARDPSSLKAVDGVYAHATPRSINSQISIAAGDSINSTYDIGEVPADAIIDPNSAYDYQAVGAAATMDVGFYYPNGGALIDVDALVAGDDVAAAGSQTLKGHGTLTTANGMKRAWELAGLAANPGGNLRVVATLKGAAASNNALINFFLRYFKAA